MKKQWTSPRVLVQEFEANEYVAACYRIFCETPNGNASYRYLFDDTNGNGQWDSGDQRLYGSALGSFSGCGNWHSGVIQSDPPSENGFVTWNRYPGWGHEAEAVFWWREDLGATSDYHVMVPGDENYETNPNAS